MIKKPINNIFCIGRNYINHALELKNKIPKYPVIFMKPSSSITNKLYSNHLGENLHFEAEICIMVYDKKPFAIAFGLDLTKRDLQSKLKSEGLPWERAKAFKNSVLFSEFKILEKEELNALNLENINLKLFIDNNLQQEGSIKDMIFSIDYLIKVIDKEFSLNNYDVIMTGTPEGVGKIIPNCNFNGQIFINNNKFIESNFKSF